MEPTIRPMQYDQMGYAMKDYYKRLSDFQAPYVKEKILMDGTMDEPTYEQAFVEWKKFVAIVRFSGKHIAMTSKTIDEVWHQMILFTHEYFQFSDEFYGSYLHHVPNIPSRPGDHSALENLVEEYQATFGEIPKMWDITFEVEK